MPENPLAGHDPDDLIIYGKLLSIQKAYNEMPHGDLPWNTPDTQDLIYRVHDAFEVQGEQGRYLFPDWLENCKEIVIDHLVKGQGLQLPDIPPSVTLNLPESMRRSEEMHYDLAKKNFDARNDVFDKIRQSQKETAVASSDPRLWFQLEIRKIELEFDQLYPEEATNDVRKSFSARLNDVRYEADLRWAISRPGRGFGEFELLSDMEKAMEQFDQVDHHIEIGEPRKKFSQTPTIAPEPGLPTTIAIRNGRKNLQDDQKQQRSRSNSASSFHGI
jgi:hypothetical protein